MKAWRAAHEPAADVPRWAVVAARAIPWVVLPAGLWRIVAVAVRPSTGPGELGYVIGLSLVSELAAFAAVGLVTPWGLRVPAWVPGVSAVVLTALWTAAGIAVVRNRSITGAPLADPSAVPFDSAVFVACYAPLLLWGPLLGVVTIGRIKRQ